MYVYIYQVHTIPVETSVVGLDATAAFAGLTDVEKSYAYHLGQADWEGSKICLLQCSPEATPIFCLLQLVFSAQPVEALVANARTRGLSDDEIDRVLCFAAAFYGNLGNYKSFGDTKFVPDISPESFEKFLLSGAADIEKTKELYAECRERLYSLPPRQRQLGLGDTKGVSTYFSANCEEEDADISGRFMDSIGLSAYNTRLFKSNEGAYTVRLASAPQGGAQIDAMAALCKEHTFEGKSFRVQRGDYGPLMSRITKALGEAVPYAANENQSNMLKRYIDSFNLGSIEEHKNGSRYWIKDKGPAVESYIGFIESYRDPSGVRGEWEGFVACVNREVSKKFGVLVDGAEDLLKLFPWPAYFEKDQFQRPDFTSLDVLAFGSSGVPAGINIPNYDDIRQNEGFKNVSLGNVLAASYGAGEKPVSFVKEGDQALFKGLKGIAFEVQVGIHELLGHGSGKLLHQNTEDVKDLLAQKTVNPLNGEPITGPFYPPGSTWDSTFGKIASTYEECRAECSGLFLCLEKAVLDVFGHKHQPDAEGGINDVSYINWLLMVRAGLVGLEFYTPATKGWRQAHMQARYVILRVLLEAGNGLVAIEQQDDAAGNADLLCYLNRGLIATTGREAIGSFLLRLQTYKSLGDVEAGQKMYNHYSEVPESMIQLRDIVMARKEPRKILVQPVMEKRENDAVVLTNFPMSFAGMIESFTARFPAEDAELLQLYYDEKSDVSD
jgi:dipeptidyl-peptidase-3